MIRYIVKQKSTGKYLRRVTVGGSKESTWVDVDNATLITTASAATVVAQQFCDNAKLPRFRFKRQHPDHPVEVIKVAILLIPAGTQPFLKNV